MKLSDRELEGLSWVADVLCSCVIAGYIAYWLTHLAAAWVDGRFQVP